MGLRHAAALTLILLASDAAAQRTGTAAVVARTRDYLLVWQQSLAAVVAEERYVQTLAEFPYGSAADSARNERSGRTLVSDVLLVHASKENAWLMFRDVISVDGASVRDRQRRFDDLFARPDAELFATARRIADEGARYNLGRLFRNVNTPIAAFVFLDERYESGVEWRHARRAEIDGRAVTELAFEQRRAPHVIRSLSGDPAVSQGKIWVEPDSGRIVRTELEVRLVRPKSSMKIVSHFGAVPGIDQWVPTRMTDEYQSIGRVEEQFKGQAIYTNHRLFRTAGRVVGAPGS